MNKVEKKILRQLAKRKVISRDEIIERYKLDNVKKTIDWLCRYNYIDIDKGISDKSDIRINDKGDEYYQSFISRRRQYRTAFITALITLIAVLLPLYILKYTGASSEESSSTLQDSIPSTYSSDHLGKSFSISEDFQFLIDKIESRSGYSYLPNSRNTIDFGYTESLSEVKPNLFYYPGGKVLLKIGDITRVLDSAILSHTYPWGNDLTEVESELDSLILAQINEKQEYFVIETIKILQQNLHEN